MDDFDGKVAVVTGTASARGIGFATAARLGGLGCRLVLADIDEPGLTERVAELRSRGTETIGVVTDVTDYDAMQLLAHRTYERFGAAHIVLLNQYAMGIPGHSLLSPEPDAWNVAIDVNLRGTMHGIKCFVPRMLVAGEPGHVLATISGAGARGTMYGNGPYVATKAAILSMMECLYGELRDAGARVRAGVVFPPFTATMGDAEAVESIAATLRATGIPVVVATPDEVAESVVDAIRGESFWAHPTVEDDARRTGGRQRPVIDWENAIYRARCDALVNRTPPDPYLWGPTTLLG
jgi:NAD(P)-dependent dehydrogenase (short-subunit alcohol dehydrogenase family)